MVHVLVPRNINSRAAIYILWSSLVLYCFLFLFVLLLDGKCVQDEVVIFVLICCNQMYGTMKMLMLFAIWTITIFCCSEVRYTRCLYVLPYYLSQLSTLVDTELLSATWIRRGTKSQFRKTRHGHNVLEPLEILVLNVCILYGFTFFWWFHYL